jgi:hypothetical protein
MSGPRRVAMERLRREVFQIVELGRSVGHSASSVESAWRSRELIPTVEWRRSVRGTG